MPRGGRREGSGRPKGATKSEGMPSKVVRVSTEITKEQLDNLPQLCALIDHYESMCKSGGDSPRYYYLVRMIEELKALGY